MLLIVCFRQSYYIAFFRKRISPPMQAHLDDYTSGLTCSGNLGEKFVYPTTSGKDKVCLGMQTAQLFSQQH